MSPDREAANAGQILQFLTTEHFTLQTERASASSDVNARVQLYMSALSATLISLALVAQLSDLGTAFRGFALVLLPTVYVFGLVTMGRLSQAWVAWFGATQGMARIRHYYIEIAPGMAPYFVTDDDLIDGRDHPAGIRGRRGSRVGARRLDHVRRHERRAGRHQPVRRHHDGPRTDRVADRQGRRSHPPVGVTRS